MRVPLSITFGKSTSPLYDRAVPVNALPYGSSAAARGRLRGWRLLRISLVAVPVKAYMALVLEAASTAARPETGEAYTGRGAGGRRRRRHRHRRRRGSAAAGVLAGALRRVELTTRALAARA